MSKGDMEDIIKGIQEMGEMIEGLPADLKDCSVGMKDDVRRIEKWGI